MKETFPGYYKGTDLVDALKTNKIIIVLDSSVLCNLYGLPDDVWKKILDLIKIKEDCCNRYLCTNKFQKLAM